LKYNTKYLAMMEVVLRTEAFYFSYAYDITHTFQRLQTSPPDFHSTPFIERADQRFVWNRYLLGHLTNSNRAAARFALPLMHGCESSDLWVRPIYV
jgi:phosphatidylinositol 4-phosphatase